MDTDRVAPRFCNAHTTHFVNNAEQCDSIEACKELVMWGIIDEASLEHNFDCIRVLFGSFEELKERALARRDLGLTSLMHALGLKNFQPVKDLIYSTFD